MGEEIKCTVYIVVLFISANKTADGYNPTVYVRLTFIHLEKQLNPSNAEATFIQSTQMQMFCEHLNLVMLVFIR